MPTGYSKPCYASAAARERAPTTRGVLIDVAALKGVDMLGDAYEITPQDVQQALRKQNITLRVRDAAAEDEGVLGLDRRAHRDPLKGDGAPAVRGAPRPTVRT